MCIPHHSTYFIHITYFICTLYKALYSQCSHLAYLSSEATEECEYELRESKGKVLVEEVSKEGGHPVIGPAAMDK